MARRKQPTIPDQLLDQLLAGADAKTAFAKDGLLDELKKALAERALIRPLVQPAIVSRTARARSASPHSREPAKAANSACWSVVAKRGDLPLMPAVRESRRSGNQTHHTLVNPQIPA